MTPDPAVTAPAPAAYAPPASHPAASVPLDAAPSPIPANERIAVLDVIRGFALWGVCVANLVPWFSGYETLPDKAKHALATWPADRVTDALLDAFVHQRFITIFSFLFGVGFSVQYLRAEARGAPAARVLARRLAAMCVIGMAHALLIWYGDILNVYAVAGVMLLVARRWPVRRLLAVGVLLAVLQPVAFVASLRIVPALLGTPLPAATPPAPMAPQTTAQVALQAVAAHNDSVYRYTLPALVARRSYGAVIEANWRMYWDFFTTTPWLPSILFELAGLCLLGLCVGRSGILRAVDTHRDRWRLALWWSSTLALVGYLPRLGLQLADVAPSRIPPDAAGLLRAVRLVAQPAMSMAYVCGIILLFQRPAWRRRLLVLAPVGRMALTNYLTQSVVAMALFYGIGFGLAGKVGPTIQVALSIAIIAAQAAISRWWLARYRFGPAEWLWRSLTYGRRQPMRVAGYPPQARPLASTP